MGLSASQARFLELTARRSNLEYQAQQICYERLNLSSKLESASSEYQDALNNKTLQFTYNDGEGSKTKDLTYTTYKNYMNQQALEYSSQQKYYLVSSNGSKVVVSSEDEINKMIEDDDTGTLSAEDFIVVDGLDDGTKFQQYIMDGTYYFATYEKDETSGDYQFNTDSWETIGNGSINQVTDTSDDAEAEAKYEKIQEEVQGYDKKLELELNEIDKERSAIDTEIDSVKKVIQDNVEGSFNIFS